jgi:hypothetical protein
VLERELDFREIHPTPPSPMAQMTGRSGCARAAPIAMGTLVPM